MVIKSNKNLQTLQIFLNFQEKVVKIEEDNLTEKKLKLS